MYSTHSSAFWSSNLHGVRSEFSVDHPDVNHNTVANLYFATSHWLEPALVCRLGVKRSFYRFPC